MAEKYSTPFIDVTDSLGVRNIVFKIEDEDFISGVYNTMKDKTLLIADGHHRYETAMNYRNFVNSPDENDKTKFVMSYFTNMEDDLMIFPTHRVITKNIDVNELLEKAGKYFDIETMPYDDSNKEEVKTAFLNYLEESNKDGIAFGLYTSTCSVPCSMFSITPSFCSISSITYLNIVSSIPLDLIVKIGFLSFNSK